MIGFSEALRKASLKISQATLRFNAKPPIQPIPEEISIWDPRVRLIDLTGYGDWLTLKTLCSGLSVMGAPGSGKTSAIAPLAVMLMELQCGFVWLCAKPDEVHLALRVAEAAGRLHDVVIIGEGPDGRITSESFNPAEYESNVPGASTGSLIKYLSACNDVLSRNELRGGKAQKGEEYWQQQFERLLRYCIEAVKLSGQTLSVEALRKVQLSAPTSTEQLANDSWAQNSFCWQCLSRAEERVHAGEVSQDDFLPMLNYFCKDYANLDQRPRSSIDSMFAAFTDSFYAEEPIRSILTKPSTVTPDDVIERGAIVILSLATNKFYEPGRMVQFSFKYSFQRAMLRRVMPLDGSHARYCVLYCDEAHSFASQLDAKYFNECRSNRGINIFLEQGVGGYMDALEVDSKEEIDRFLAGLGTKIFFQNSSPLSNEFGADVIAKQWLSKETININSGEGGANAGRSYTDEERYHVIPGDFTRLRRGGPENGFLVEGYVTMVGQIFNATGTNCAKCLFPQTELTR